METSLAKGGTFQFTLQGARADKVFYTSTDPAIATVDETGKIKAVAKGDTFVVASTGSKHFLCRVHVTSGGEPAKYTDSRLKVLQQKQKNALVIRA